MLFKQEGLNLLIIFEWINTIYAWIGSKLLHVTNAYGVAILFAVFYFTVMKLTTQKIQQREYQKRAKIINDIKQSQTEAPPSGTKAWFNNEPTEEEIQRRNQQIDIVNQHNGKPGRILAAMLVQGMLFASFIVYFSTVKSVPHTDFMPVIAVILSLFAYLTRKTVIINIIFIPMVYYASMHFSGTANIFYDSVFILQGVNKFYNIYKNKKNKQGKTIQNETT